MGDECIDLMMRAQQQISYDLVERKNCVFLITATRMQSTFVVIDTLPVACF